MIEPIQGIKTDKNTNFYIDLKRLNPIKEELETFLKDEKEMKTLSFSKKVMQSQEVKTNNNIEGYFDNIEEIEEIIKNDSSIKDKEKRSRIINLYKGYKYILTKQDISKENLKTLYKVLSKDLLSKYDLDHMGPYYRDDDVFIYYSDNVQIPPDKGIQKQQIEEHMNNYFKFLNNQKEETMTDHYVKSQIAHFYFIYIHPYFDINGRTARTTSMWHLLKNEAYPYIIFNRGIGNTKNIYYKEILKAKQSNNLTSFINYLLKSVKQELEKEYIMQVIQSTQNKNLSTTEITTILDILSMKGLRTLKDYTYLYNQKNEKKRIKDIKEEMLDPLLEKNIITKERETNGRYNHSGKNFVFSLNKDKLELDKNKVKMIKL